MRSLDKLTNWWKSGKTPDRYVSEPVYEIANITDQLMGVFYKLGRATIPSPIRGEKGRDEDERVFGRSLPNRMERGRLTRKLLESGDRKSVLTPEVRRNLRLLDEFDRQFLTQNEYKVETP